MKLQKMRRVLLVALAVILLSASAQAATYKTLKFGSSGAEVLQMQNALVKLGYQVGTVDGKFGSFTETAVRKFQQACGLTVDGLAGSKTLTMLYQMASASAPTPAPVPAISFGGDYSTIQMGDSGLRVQLLQSALNALGFGKLTVDGKFGLGTLAAVQNFQASQGLAIDGKAGRATLTRMEKLGGGNAAVTVPTPAPTIAPTATPRPTAQPTATVGGYSAPTRTLYPGSSGDDVRMLQRRLAELGFYKGTIDGKYGSGTTAAVMAFQQANALSADGIAGAKTYAKLFAGSAAPSVPTAAPTPAPTAAPVPQPTYSGTYTTLKKGSTGAEVKRLQGALALLDYTTNTYGTYDNKTVSAVREFQSRNGLSVDGIAGPQTLALLYSGNAKRGPTNAGIADGVGAMAAPSVSQLRLLHWYNDVKPTIKKGQNVLVYDPVTGLSWNLYLMSLGRHADVEPLTALDTAIQFRAFGNQEDWGPKLVYVRLPSGTWTIAGLANVAHNTQTIRTNNFNGQNCLHFLRDMEECQRMDPKTGVNNQNTIRKFWLELTGQTITN